jgi:hypothetical protein
MWPVCASARVCQGSGGPDQAEYKSILTIAICQWYLKTYHEIYRFASGTSAAQASWYLGCADMLACQHVQTSTGVNFALVCRALAHNVLTYSGPKRQLFARADLEHSLAVLTYVDPLRCGSAAQCLRHGAAALALGRPAAGAPPPPSHAACPSAGAEATSVPWCGAGSLTLPWAHTSD